MSGRRWVGAAAVTCLLVMVGLVGWAAPAAQAAGPGSLLFNETFQGASVPDPGVVPLNDACLTGASAAPPAGSSTIPRCTRTAGSPAAGVVPGYLQLNDVGGSRTGGMVYNRPLPSSGGLVVTFDQYQYGGVPYNGRQGDGIAFFLTDGSTQLTSAGAYGGSLGYAQRTGASGVHAAYLGVGLDSYGNFVNDAEGRGAGCAVPSPRGSNLVSNVVTIRGGGDGGNGYCYLSSTSNAANQSTLPGSLRAATGPAAAARTVRITVSPDVRPTVTVEIDFHDGSGFRTVLTQLMPQNVPPTYKFGFTAGTGGASDVHLIRNVVVSSVNPLGALSLTKQVNNATPQPASYGVGDTVPYQFLVVNTSVVALSGVTVTDPKITNVVCPRATLTAAGDTNSRMTCTGSYTITAANASLTDAFTNTATAAAVDGAGNPIASNPSSVTVPITPAPSITLAKSAHLNDGNGNGLADPGETIAYSFTVTNTGNQPLAGVGVIDGKAGAVACPSATLAPGVTQTCTATYTVTQGDVDAGVVHNSATASGKAPAGTTVTSPPATTDTPTPARAPSIIVAKAAALHDLNGNGLADPGETIGYTFTVTNNGNVTLTGVGVTDAKAGTVTCPTGTLAPAASQVCAATYTVTQADVDAGIVHNSATATGTPPVGPPLTSPAASTDTAVAVHRAAVALDKQGTLNDVNRSGAADVGETVAYRFTVTNSGNVTLTGIIVNDPKITGAGCPATTLAPGASQVCTATYTVTQADVDAGVVHNSATATGTPPAGPAVTSPPAANNIDTVAPAPGIVLDKQGTLNDPTGNLLANLGQTINYRFTVTNSGNVTLTGIIINDPKITGASCPSTTLARGANQVCTASYTVTQADIDAGVVANTATAAGTPPPGDGPATTSPPASNSMDTVAPTPDITLAKTGALVDGNGNGTADVGEKVNYTFTATNSGNVTLTAITVTDPKIGPASCNPASGALAPRTTRTCSGTYTVTQADVDAGQVFNTATANGTPPPGDGAAVTSKPATAAIPATQTPALSLSKNGAVVGGVAGQVVGGNIAYTFTVTNVGNQTLTAVSITDAHTGPVSCPAGPLAPGQQLQCTGAYSITQTDLNTGHVANTATAAAVTPGGDPIVSPPSTATIPLTQAPALTVLKKATAAGGVNEVGDVIDYTFTVTNTGNVTVTGIGVTDLPIAPAGPSSPPLCQSLLTPVGTCAGSTAALVPGQAATFTASYAITQADLDHGRVSDKADVAGTAPDGTPVRATSNTVTEPPLTQTPRLTVVKAGVPVGPVNAVGDVIDYTFTVTNTGNVTVSGVGVTDLPVGPAGPSSPPVCVSLSGPDGTCAGGSTVLAPQQSALFTASYAITQADLDLGSVSDTADTAGTAPDGAAVEGHSLPVKVTLAQTRALTLKKTATTDGDPVGVITVGQVLTYQFAVTNTGNVTLSDIAIEDGPFTGAGPLPIPVCPRPDLGPGQSQTCTSTYTVTQADVNSDDLVNTATATGTPPGTTTSVRSQQSTVVLHSSPRPGLTVLKMADRKAASKIGDVVDYTFTVTNTGNVTVSGVGVTDVPVGPAGLSSPPVCQSLDAPAGTCAGGTTVLAPQQSATFTAHYAITQSDLDHGSVSDTADTAGTAPDGKAVEGHSPLVTVTLARTPALTLKKTATTDGDPVGVITVGQVLTYQFAVTNTGNVTLSDIAIEDGPFTGAGPLPIPVCPRPDLGPGQSQTCTSTYTVTQADVNSDDLVNTATATGRPPGATTSVRSQQSTVTLHSSPRPGLTVRKTADRKAVSTIGAVIDYTFSVTNTGNVTLSAVTVTDLPAAPTRALNAPPACDHLSQPTGTCPSSAALTLQPGQSATFTARYLADQIDLDHGSITDTAIGSGIPPAGSPTIRSAPATATVTATQSPALTVTKTSNVSTFTAGQTIRYTFTVTNTGNTTVHAVTIIDTPVAPTRRLTSGPGCPRSAASSLAPGRVVVCTGTYVATASDETYGSITDVALARALTPGSRAVVSAGVRLGIRATSTPVPPVQPPQPVRPVNPPPASLPNTGLNGLGETAAGSLLLLVGGFLVLLGRRRKPRRNG